jgi:hypothetical protein
MKDGYIESQIRRCNRNFLIANMMVILCVALVLGLTHNLLYNAFYGPFDTDARAIAQVEDVQELERFHVSFEHGGVFERNRGFSEFDEFIAQLENTNGYKINFVKVEDKYLIVTTPRDQMIDSSKISGALYPLGQEIDVYHEMKSASFDLLPFMMDSTGVLEENVSSLLFLCSPFAIVFFINVIRYFIRLLLPDRHPIMRRIRKLGDKAEIIEEIDQEMPNAKVMYKKYRVTEHWIVRQDTFTTKIARNPGKETNVLQMGFKH